MSADAQENFSVVEPAAFLTRWVPAGARVFVIQPAAGEASGFAAPAADFLSAQPLQTAEVSSGRLGDEGELLGIERGARCDVLILLSALSAVHPDHLYRQALALSHLRAGTVLALWPTGTMSFAPTHYCALFEQFGFSPIRQLVIGWDAMVLLHSDARSHARASLAGILENDAKTTTYKLALLRALCDINIACPGRVSYLPEASADPIQAVRRPYCAPDAAQIPFALVVECVMSYYWGIFVAKTPVRQIQEGRSLGFEAALKQLIVHYGGDWLALRRDWYAGRLNEAAEPADVVEAFTKAFEAVADALQKGPIHCAGNSLPAPDGTPAGNRLFRTTGKPRGALKSVLTPELAAKRMGGLILPAWLWRELNFAAPYASDAVLLEWAKLSMRFSELAGLNVKLGDALEALMPPEDARDVELAKALYGEAAQAHCCRCVWSAQNIRPNNLAVDHLLPWSRTHTNDLWNLVPATRTTNLQKSDKLPTPELLDAAAPRLYEAWRMLDRSNCRGLFRAQAENHFLGSSLLKLGWERQLLDAVTKTADLVARQFSAQRWSGPTLFERARQAHRPSAHRSRPASE